MRTLAKLGERLVAIHGQSSEQELADPAAPLELLDAFAKTDSERSAVEDAAAAWKEAQERLDALEESRRQRGEKLEMLDFQIREIESVGPTEAEESALPVERERLLHADRIRSAGEAALAALTEAEGAAADRLGEAARAFGTLAAIDPSLGAHREEAEDLKRRIADLAAAARDAAESVEGDPARLTAIETRLEQLARLKRKYGPSASELLARLSDMKEERAELSHVEEALDRRRREAEKSAEAYRKAAAALSRKRQAAASRFSAAVEKELRGLALEKAKLRLALETLPDDRPRPGGLETGAFLFAPNPGETEKPLEKIASGGELSRLQLAIRSVASGRGPGPDARLRRGRRGNRRAGRRSRRPQTPRARRLGAGPLRHARPADRRARPDAPARGEARDRRPHRRVRAPARRPGARGRDCADAGRRNDPGDGDEARPHSSRGGPMTDSDRYSRSTLFPGIGTEGQERIRGFSIVFIGAGAVGAAAAEEALRAGVGRLTIVDRDVVEPSNLTRQFLFDADDAARIAPKAEAAAARLAEIDPAIPVRAVVDDLSAANARDLLSGHDLVFDASDNFETRLLVSDAARSLGRPSFTPPAWARRGGSRSSVPGAPVCAATSRRSPRRARGRPATRSASCRRCRRSWPRSR